MSTTNPTFTERTAVLMRLPASSLVPKPWKELIADMAAALDNMAAALDNQAVFNDLFLKSMNK
jgi:hypothetical protein